MIDFKRGGREKTGFIFSRILSLLPFHLVFYPLSEKQLLLFKCNLVCIADK